MKKLGEVIREQRKRRGWTIQEMAEKLPIEIDGGNLSRLERGIQGGSEKLKVAIANAFNMSVADLYALTDLNYKNEPVKGDSSKPSNVKVPVVSMDNAYNWIKTMDSALIERHIDSPSPVAAGDFYVTVTNDSMTAPTGGVSVPVGSMIKVSVKGKPGGNMLVMAAKPGGAPIFRQLVTDGGKKYLNPLNNKYPLIDFDGYKLLGCVRSAILNY